MNTRDNLDSLKPQVIGHTADSMDFFFQVDNKTCNVSPQTSDSYSTSNATPAKTTSSPLFTSSPHFLEIYVFLSVNIIEPLVVRLDPISDNSIQVSVINLKSKDKTSPVVQCFVNSVEITNSPHFKVPKKLKLSSREDHLPTYEKVENQVRAKTVSMKCWSVAYWGPLTCSASMSGHTYWSNTLYLSKHGNLRDCENTSSLVEFSHQESSGITRLVWDCQDRNSSYTVHFNRSVSDGSCPSQLQTEAKRQDILEPGDNSSLCSVETDLLEPGTMYKVWVTTADGLLHMDVTDVLIPEKRRSNPTQVMLWVSVGVAAFVASLTGFLVWRSRRKSSTNWNEEEVLNLNKENMERYEASDIVILHITNSETV